MGHAAQEFVAAIVMNDRLGDHGAEARHALGQPARHPAIMQGQIGTSGPFRHDFLRLSRNRYRTILSYRPRPGHDRQR
ncbi:hypothetical protein ACFQ4K_02070 [Tistrella bauzanensis]